MTVVFVKEKAESRNRPSRLGDGQVSLDPDEKVLPSTPGLKTPLRLQMTSSFGIPQSVSKHFRLETEET